MSEEKNELPEENTDNDTSDLDIVITGSIVSDYNEKPFPIKMYYWKVEEEFADVPQPNFDLIISQEVLLKVNRHLSKTLKEELGGFLLGNRYYCPTRKRDYIQIDNFSDAKFSSADEISLTLTHETWFQLQMELDGKNKGKQLMGWYHSHPKMSVFISPMDVIVHRDHFGNNKFAVALVVEPEKMTGGFFCWRWDPVGDPFGQEKTLHQNARMNFYELKDTKSDRTYMPWSEYTCFDCETTSVVKPQVAEEYAAIRPGPGLQLLPEPEVKEKENEQINAVEKPDSIHTTQSKTTVGRKTRSLPPVVKDENAYSKRLYPAVAALLGLVIVFSLGYGAVKYFTSNPTPPVTANSNQNTDNSTVVQKETPAELSPTSQSVDNQPSSDLMESYFAEYTKKPYYLILKATDDNFDENYEVLLEDLKLEPAKKGKIKRADSAEKNDPKTLYYEIPKNLDKLENARPNQTLFLSLKLKERESGIIAYKGGVKGTIGSAERTSNPVPPRPNPPISSRPMPPQKAAADSGKSSSKSEQKKAKTCVYDVQKRKEVCK